MPLVTKRFSIYLFHKLIASDEDKMNWNLFPNVCNRLTQWALMPLGKTLYRNNKEGTVIKIYDNRDDN